jgi:hypothetical protein
MILAYPSWPALSPQVGFTRLAGKNIHTEVGQARLPMPSTPFVIAVKT